MELGEAVSRRPGCFVVVEVWIGFRLRVENVKSVAEPPFGIAQGRPHSKTIPLVLSLAYRSKLIYPPLGPSSLSYAFQNSQRFGLWD